MGQTYSPPSEHHNALLRVKISDNGVIVHCVLDNFLVGNLFEIDDIFGLFRTYIMGMQRGGWQKNKKLNKLSIYSHIWTFRKYHMLYFKVQVWLGLFRLN